MDRSVEDEYDDTWMFSDEEGDEFENALESLKSAFCLYAECKDLSDPYDDHQQPRRNELRRTFKRKF